jgi:hypothetical protein
MDIVFAVIGTAIFLGVYSLAIRGYAAGRLTRMAASVVAGLGLAVALAIPLLPDFEEAPVFVASLLVLVVAVVGATTYAIAPSLIEHRR